MKTSLEILEKFWGYQSFRHGQDEVIEAIINRKDTLAIFPTGAGKSICFQVPGLMLEGLTLVISPLIALMKDQVESLNKRDIPAIALNSGMGWKEIRQMLDNALKGRYKFLYISPERANSENFREYIPNLNIKLLVVDEAHCISQWGYDFRPSYLKLAECRDLLPKVPCVAFTASAPPKIRTDICDKLQLKNPAIFIAPFRRKNLHFYAIETENKTGILYKSLAKSKGSAIVFCNSRRETEEISRFLNDKKLVADFYHAGLNAVLRSKKQDAWMRDKVRIMVCTNAFGMGVDKPDVRYVFHFSAGGNPDAYYQEAGRAGRDGNNSWCVLLYRNHDFFELEERLKISFPGVNVLENCYNAVCNSLSIAAGGGMDQSYRFDLNEIANRYKMPASQLFYAISNLETLGFWALSDGFYSPSKVVFSADFNEVYNFKIKYKKFETILDVLLRSYGGVFDGFVKINEKQLATRIHTTEEIVKQKLNELTKASILHYEPASDAPSILFTEPRSPYPNFKMEVLDTLKQNHLQAIRKMREYVETDFCRSFFWENYYGVENKIPCEVCDLCIRRKKQALSKDSIEAWSMELEGILNKNRLTRTELIDNFGDERIWELREIIRWMMDNKKILIDANQKLYWKG